MAEFKILAESERTGILIITTGLEIHNLSKPNRWHRFWQRILLGWEWK